MKKILLGILSISCFSTISNAQIELAPEAGVNLSKVLFSYGIPGDRKIKLGLRFGTAVNIPVLKGLYIQPGLFYAGKGAISNTEIKSVGVTYRFNERMNFDYLEIPVNLMYRYKIGKAGSVFATAGPYLGYAVSAKTKNKFDAGPPFNSSESITQDIKIGNNKPGHLRPLDFGLNFGVGYQAPFGVFLRMQYGLGLSNIGNQPSRNYSNSYIFLKNRGVGIALGYALPLGGK